MLVMVVSMQRALMLPPKDQRKRAEQRQEQAKTRADTVANVPTIETSQRHHAGQSCDERRDPIEIHSMPPIHSMPHGGNRLRNLYARTKDRSMQLSVTLQDRFSVS
ncbi:hypothetical protein NKH10_26595 [Mesorhizobium sp. M1340]|uniref:hypothetical protein n=1 Tax=Mesorhizobium sp. M1340 TaxID=2957087 RepID=UPI00333BF5CD